MWFDSHCHLHMCAEDRSVEDVIAEARAAGVMEMVTVGLDEESNQRCVELTVEEGIYAAVGVHPNSATGWNDQTSTSFERLLSDPRVVAVGESGLDFYRDWAPQDDQRRAFLAHIELAKRYDKALVIHTRDSLPATLDVLETESPPERFVLHCWSGTEVDLGRARALDAYVSFAGNVSFKSAEALRAVVPLVPEDRLLIETDSPFLTPVPHRGKPNSPAHVVHVGAALAGCLGATQDEIAELTTTNARRFFALA
ncbi:MAG: TatD family hydrolase [Actinobacteria bacterium]|nr:TatD family hydrolase [Actinomycetota bacterium]